VVVVHICAPLQDEWTPLHDAAHEGNPEVAQILIDAKANIDAAMPVRQ